MVAMDRRRVPRIFYFFLDPRKKGYMTMIIQKVLKRLAVVGLMLPVVPLLFLLFRAFQARSMPPLQAWHAPTVWPDTLTQQDALRADFDAYLAAEAELLDTIHEAHTSSDLASLNRYTSDSIYSPYVAGENLNASFHLFPPGEMKGGILLLHGLTGSPYSLRALAKSLAEEGYYVLALRLPGHGTVPGALTQVQWQEWQQATLFGAQVVQQEIAKHQASDFIIGGMSLGGTLALNYTLQALVTEAQPLPDKVLLLAPAIGINPMAALAGYTRWLSWIPYFAQFGWNSIALEYDPFRYYSFPMNSIDQTYRLIETNNQLAAELAHKPERLAQMPPIIAFQTIVDYTVKTDALINWFADYGTPDSTLVLFDINRALAPFMNQSVVDTTPTDVLTHPNFRSRLIAITNQPSPAGDRHTELLNATLYQPNEAGTFIPQELATPPDLRWPTHVTALSHISLLIAPDDPYYGIDTQLPPLHLHGEYGVSAISDFYALRQRYNPFFGLLTEQIVALLEE